MNKKIILVLIILILAVGVAVGAYYLGVKQGQSKSGTVSAKHTVVTCMQDFNLEQKKTDAGAITNPMENLPETNPFNKVKTNPFE